MKINILYRQLFDLNGNDLMIGGVETYITNLIILFINKGYEVNIYQFAERNFEKKYMGATVIGISPCGKYERLYRERIKKMVVESYKRSDIKKDILIFATDNDIVSTNYKKVIAIQHGIGWDIHQSNQKHNLTTFLFSAKNLVTAYACRNKFFKCSKIVCVDYNFINWYRTCIHDDLEYFVIPNFSKLPVYNEKKQKLNVSIIFARRFQIYRGTRIFTEAIVNILKCYPDVQLTIAGDGPEEEFLREKLGGYPNVIFTRFLPRESIEIHSNFDIAIVPSTGSEGTSLSLLEAMASGCAVICTDVGGLTNIIINGHNGIIVRPNSNDLQNAIKLLIDDCVLRNKLSRCAYETVKDSFDIEEWSKRWIEVIEKC